MFKKTISIEEIANFGWYLRKIKSEKIVADYCNNNGFYDIIKLADKNEIENAMVSIKESYEYIKKKKKYDFIRPTKPSN